MFTRRKRVAALFSAVLLGTTVALSWTTAAQAATNAGLPPGSTVCSEKIRSSLGVAFYGGMSAPVANPAPLWTVHASTSETGPETELLRLPSGEPSTTYVSWPGTLFYKLCITNTTTARGGLRFSFFAQDRGAVGGIGPATAVLGPTGSYCALWAIAPARLIGSSTVPVRWWANVTNFDDERVRTDEFGTSTNLDRQVLGPEEIFDVCVSNTSSSTATISLDVAS